MIETEEEDEVEFETETIEISSFIFEITTISYLPIEMLMKNQSKGVEISGQKVWCGSLCVVDYLLKNEELLNNKLIIELGAGTGVLGMVCSRIGCKRLLLTDNDPRSIKHMIQDCSQNKVLAEVKVLDWFSPDINILDISTSEESTKICIVAGDVLYKNVLLEPFFTTAQLLLLVRKDSIMFLCHVPRAGVDHSDVINMAQKMGLTIIEINLSSEEKQNTLKYCPEEDIIRSKLYKIQLNS